MAAPRFHTREESAAIFRVSTAPAPKPSRKEGERQSSDGGVASSVTTDSADDHHASFGAVAATLLPPANPWNARSEQPLKHSMQLVARMDGYHLLFWRTHDPRP